MTVIEKDIKDISQQNYGIYSMSIILGRSIPDVRDGLKPVHRRILYGMYNDGFTSDKPHRKCAKIVGNVMGSYHPHGDSSIYDALVRLSQPFSNNIPLIDFHGNGGSLGGDSAAANRYCLTEDELLLKPDGSMIKMKNIRKIKDNSEISINDETCLDYIGNIQKYTKFFNSGKHPIKKISTNLGFNIKGSYNHPILTMNAKSEFVWKTLDEINVNDKVLLKLGNLNPDDFSISEDEKEIAIFWGGMISEGYISKNQKYYRVGFSNQDKIYYDYIKKGFTKYQNKFNLNLRERLPEETKGNVYSIDTESKIFYNFISDEVNMLCSKKEIPEFILSSNINVQRYFLKSLFEGDGGCQNIYDKRRDVYYGHIYYDSKSETLIKQIQIILLNLGIRSSIHKDKRCEVIKLSIYDIKSINIFKEKIGFISHKKNTILEDILLKNLEKNNRVFGSTKYEIIPGLKDKIISVSKKNLNKLKKLDIGSKKGFYKYENIIKESIDDITFNIIKENMIIYENYIYDSVKSIENLKDSNVYSIKVDTEDHSFIASGFINHNTEARLEKYSQDYILADIRKNAVDFTPTYDSESTEPSVLPAKFPLILVNGASGIAAGGYATEIPSHNIVDVCNTVVNIIDSNGELSLQDIARSIRPDFPTGGILCSNGDIYNAYTTGRGNVKYRAKIIHEQKKNKNYLVITEIPFGKTIDSIIENIVFNSRPSRENEKPFIDEIHDIRDESSKGEVRVVIELKKDADPAVIENKLYKHTECETTLKIILIATKGLTFKQYNIKEIFMDWLHFRRETIKRVLLFDIRKFKNKIHISEGLIIALLNIDKVIKIIKNSKDTETAKNSLVSALSITLVQASAILDMKLSKLTSLEEDKINKEVEELKLSVAKLIDIVKSEKAIDEMIKNEQLEIIEKFKRKAKRKTLVTDIDTSVTTEDVITDEDFLISISNDYYIKRTKHEIKSQNRGGKGTNNGKTKDGDFIRRMFYANSKDHLLVFTTDGRMFDVKVWQIDESTMNSVGKSIRSYLKLTAEDKIACIINISNEQFENSDNSLIFSTKNGLVKKTSMEEYNKNKIRENGIISIKIKENDELLDVRYLVEENNPDIFIATKDGIAIRFNNEQVPRVFRTTYGVKGITIREGDEVVSFEVIESDDSMVFTVTNKGLGKKVDISQFPTQNRGGKGRILTGLKDKDYLVKALIDYDNKEAIIISKEKMLKTETNNFNNQLRPSYGSRIINLNKSDEVTDFVIISIKSEE